MSLDAIGLVSQDLEKTTEFYRYFGVDLKVEGGPDHREGETPSGVRIMADSVKLMKELNPSWVKPSGSGIVLCFKQAAPEKVDELFCQVTAAGFSQVKAPWDAFWGQRYASVLDPDGNQVDIFAQL